MASWIFALSKTRFTIDFTRKTPGMHFYCCNDAVPWLNEAKSWTFRCTVIFKNFQIHLYFICHLPAICCKTWFRYVYRSNFSHKECNSHLQYESVVPKKIYPLHPGDPLHPSFAFIVVSNSQKKVSITPGLYFPNYCVTYLPRDISHNFNKCEHVNLRQEWMRGTTRQTIRRWLTKRRRIIKKV